jgi:hypothetical protein
MTPRILVIEIGRELPRTLHRCTREPASWRPGNRPCREASPASGPRAHRLRHLAPVRISRRRGSVPLALAPPLLQLSLQLLAARTLGGGNCACAGSEGPGNRCCRCENGIELDRKS